MATTRSWDAATYDRVAGPQEAWAQAILDRLQLAGDETVLDAGCGSGRVTRLLLDRLPRGRVIGVDADAGMVAHARAVLPAERVDVRQADLTRLDLAEPVDAVFSDAVFHWIPHPAGPRPLTPGAARQANPRVHGHDVLFERLLAALRPGGRLSAQCGGRGNIARVTAAAEAAGVPRPEGVWTFAGPDETAARLHAAGFAEIECWLEDAPARPDDPRQFLETVCLGPYLERLPAAERPAFVDRVHEQVGGEIDYVRLNIVARRPA